MASRGRFAGAWTTGRHPDGWDRRGFLRWLARTGIAAAVLPTIPGWARAATRTSGGCRASAPLARPTQGSGLAANLETSRAWRVMGTLMEVRIPDLPEAEAIAAIRAVRRRVETLEAALTLFRPESPLVALNAGGEREWRDVPPELADAVRHALLAQAASGGVFDPTVAPAMRAWGLQDLTGRAAPAAFLRAWASRPGVDAIVLDAPNRRLRRLDRRVELDLGGIGKGIAVDEALAMLRTAGSCAALVNLGGEIGVLGAPVDRPEGWPIGIAHPRRSGETCYEFPLRTGHIATSGDYERWVDTPSGRKHHLLDPWTGEPALGVASLTVWAPTGRAADVASTAGFIQVARGATAPDIPHYLVRDQAGSLVAEGMLAASS